MVRCAVRSGRAGPTCVGGTGALCDVMDVDVVIDWLLDPGHSDPLIRWQVMRDLLGAPQAEWEAERARVETEGWGARLLALEDDDGPGEPSRWATLRALRVLTWWEAAEAPR